MSDHIGDANKKVDLIETVARVLRDETLKQCAVLSKWHSDGRTAIGFDLQPNVLAEATLRAIEAAGYRIVPVEPTEEMYNSGEYAWEHRRLDDEHSNPLRDCYRAMLDAVPKVVP